jgi:hypothetical protein
MSPRRIEWLNQNKYRKYPFVEDEQAVSGSVTLPDDAMLDFQAVHFRHDPGGMRLSQVEILDLGGGLKFAEFTFTYLQPVGPWSSTVMLSVAENAVFPYDANVNNAGVQNVKAVFGEGVVDFLQANPVGVYAFRVNIEPALVSYQNRHRVESVAAIGASPSEELDGAIHVQEGYNCAVAVFPDLNRIRISAIVGAGAGVVCDPPEGGFNCNEVLLRINGLHADDNGNFMLLAGSGMVAISDPDNHRVILRGAQPKEELVCG